MSRFVLLYTLCVLIAINRNHVLSIVNVYSLSFECPKQFKYETVRELRAQSEFTDAGGCEWSQQ